MKYRSIESKGVPIKAWEVVHTLKQVICVKG